MYGLAKGKRIRTEEGNKDRALSTSEREERLGLEEIEVFPRQSIFERKKAPETPINNEEENELKRTQEAFKTLARILKEAKDANE